MKSALIFLAGLLSAGVVRAEAPRTGFYLGASLGEATVELEDEDSFYDFEGDDTSYKLFHGAVWLDADKATTNYRWGGLQCKGRELSDTSVQLLFAAFRSEYQVAVEYVISEYKGKQFRCLTGFTITKS